jgi:RNA polymerase sigma-70 factor (ECF subfamily)
MSSQTERSEEISLAALKAGERAEFARMVEANYEMIYRLALRMMENVQDAEDVLQETFIKAYRYINDFDGRSSLSTWLYRIATNEALMLLRKRKGHNVSLDQTLDENGEEQEPIQIVDWCCLPEEMLMSSEAQEKMKQAADSLPPGLKAVFVLRDIQGLSTRETSEVLELSEMAVKTRLSRARFRLRESLSSYFGVKMLEGKREA